jgi:hypothetical protein
MITRQRILLKLLELEGGQVSKRRLFKLAFLLREDGAPAPSSALYEFIPYQFGPYSFTLNYELRSLERDGSIRLLDADVVAMRPPRDKPHSAMIEDWELGVLFLSKSSASKAGKLRQRACGQSAARKKILVSSWALSFRTIRGSSSGRFGHRDSFSGHCSEQSFAYQGVKQSRGRLVSKRPPYEKEPEDVRER